MAFLGEYLFFFVLDKFTFLYYANKENDDEINSPIQIIKY